MLFVDVVRYIRGVDNRRRLVHVLVVQAAEGAVHRALELVRRAADGLVQVDRVFGDGNWL